MLTRLEKVEYLTSLGCEIKINRKLQKTGYIRTYIIEINGVHFTTSSSDQRVAGNTLDSLYWFHKLQEDKDE